MGLYAIKCVSCGEVFMWFSGSPDQRCRTCIGQGAYTIADIDHAHTTGLREGLRQAAAMADADADRARRGMEGATDPSTRAAYANQESALVSLQSKLAIQADDAAPTEVTQLRRGGVTTFKLRTEEEN